MSYSQDFQAVRGNVGDESRRERETFEKWNKSDTPNGREVKSHRVKLRLIKI